MHGWTLRILRFFLSAATAAAILFSVLPATAQTGEQTSSVSLTAGRLYEIVVPAADYEGCALRASFFPSSASGYHVLELGEYLGGSPVAARSYMVDGADRESVLNLSLAPRSSDRSSHCLQAPLPTTVERGLTSDALDEIEMNGELGRMHLLSGIKVEDVFYLRDISRRESNRGHDLGNAGRMAERAALETLVYRDFFAAGTEITREDLAAVFPVTMAFTSPELSSATEAHINAGATYDALLALGINGHDNLGGSIFSIVARPHPLTDIVNSCTGGVIPAGSSFNAFAMDNVLFYTPSGEYSRQGIRYLNSYASLLDVVAHEYAHAITDSASDLAYRHESGALNEAFSDWIGVAVQAVATGQVDWRIAEGRNVEIISSSAKRELDEIRNLKNPNLQGDPQRVAGTYWQNPNCAATPCNDYCGVHTNSGVANHAFYLMVEGAAETSTIGDLVIPPFVGMGITVAIKLGLYANLNLWSRNETLASAADDMVLAAVQLHGAGSPQANAVECAWASVGVNRSNNCSTLSDTLSDSPRGRRIDGPLDALNIQIGKPLDVQIGGLGWPSLLWLLCMALMPWRPVQLRRVGLRSLRAKESRQMNF